MLTRNSYSLDYEFIPTLFKSLPLILSLLGVLVALSLNTLLRLIRQKTKIANHKLLELETSRSIYRSQVLRLFVKSVWFLNHKWYIDLVYNYYIGFSVLKHSYDTFYKLIDKGLIEICGVQGLGKVIYGISTFLSRKQSGYIYHSASLIILSFFLLICLLFII
jgi:flagellar biosynthesis protein FlhB